MPEFPNKNDERERVSNTLHGAVTARILRSILRLSLSIPTPLRSLSISTLTNPILRRIQSNLVARNNRPIQRLALPGFCYFNFMYASTVLSFRIERASTFLFSSYVKVSTFPAFPPLNTGNGTFFSILPGSRTKRGKRFV